jgi:hypothetical protein
LVHKYRLTGAKGKETACKTESFLEPGLSYHTTINQTRLIKQLTHYTLNLAKGFLHKRLPGNQYNIKARTEFGMKQVHHFSHDTAGAVADNGLTNLLARYKAITIVGETIGHDTDDHPAGAICPPFGSNSGKITALAKSQMPLHPTRLGFPVDFLDVIGLDRQQVTTDGAAS